MAGREIEGPILPHMDFGDPECCGTLWPLERPDQPGTTDIICSECQMVVRTVPTADLQRTLDEMESRLELATTKCPYCGSVNLFPGFTGMLAYTCTYCGEPVSVSDPAE